MRTDKIAIFLSSFLGIVFLLAAFSKINDLVGFRSQLQDIIFLKPLHVGLISLLLPGFELVLGICLLFRMYWKETIFLSTLLLMFFLVYTILNKGNASSGCGCFKIQGTLLHQFAGWKTIVRDILFVVISAWLFLCHSKQNDKN